MRIIMGMIGLVLAMSVSGCLGVEIVDTGHRGIKTRYGKVEPQSLEEGMYFYNPLTSSIIEMDVRTKRFDVESDAYTRDVQQAKVTAVLNYNLEKTKAHEIYQNVGRDWEERLIPQTVAGALKSVVGKWDAVDLIGNRQKAQMEIQERIATALADKDVHVTAFEIVNIDYADQFEHAVEAKVVAVQEAIKSQNETVKVAEEAKQRVITAKAEAESMSIRAQALTQNQALVEYEAVQKWDGHLPQYVLGDAVPFISMNPAK